MAFTRPVLRTRETLSVDCLERLSTGWVDEAVQQALAREGRHIGAGTGGAAAVNRGPIVRSL